MTLERAMVNYRVVAPTKKKKAAAEIEDSALDATVYNSAEQGSEASGVIGAIQTKYPLIEGAVFAKMH